MGKRTEFLYLSEQDMIDAGVNDYARCVDVCVRRLLRAARFSGTVAATIGRRARGV